MATEDLDSGRGQAAHRERLIAANRGWIGLLVGTGSGIAPTLLRLALAVVIFPHGAQKLLGWFGGYGYAGTMGFFTGTMGIPAFFAFLAIMAEFFGSLGLLTGLFTRVSALGIGVVMIVALLTTHLGNGFFMDWGGTMQGEGFEFHILVLGIVAALLVAGGGKASVDRLLTRKLARE